MTVMEMSENCHPLFQAAVFIALGTLAFGIGWHISNLLLGVIGWVFLAIGVAFLCAWAVPLASPFGP